MTILLRFLKKYIFFGSGLTDWQRILMLKGTMSRVDFSGQTSAKSSSGRLKWSVYDKFKNQLRRHFFIGVAEFVLSGY